MTKISFLITDCVWRDKEGSTDTIPFYDNIIPALNYEYIKSNTTLLHRYILVYLSLINFNYIIFNANISRLVGRVIIFKVKLILS